MKKQIACPHCQGKGFITLAAVVDDLCGIGSKLCAECGGTGLQETDMTNADRIRSMTDEELVGFINHFNVCDNRTSDECRISYCAVCEICVLDWLRDPVKPIQEGTTDGK